MQQLAQLAGLGLHIWTWPCFCVTAHEASSALLECCLPLPIQLPRSPSAHPLMLAARKLPAFTALRMRQLFVASCPSGGSGFVESRAALVRLAACSSCRLVGLLGHLGWQHAWLSSSSRVVPWSHTPPGTPDPACAWSPVRSPLFYCCTAARLTFTVPALCLYILQVFKTDTDPDVVLLRGTACTPDVLRQVLAPPLPASGGLAAAFGKTGRRLLCAAGRYSGGAAAGWLPGVDWGEMCDL